MEIIIIVLLAIIALLLWVIYDTKKWMKNAQDWLDEKNLANDAKEFEKNENSLHGVEVDFSKVNAVLKEAKKQMLIDSQTSLSIIKEAVLVNNRTDKKYIYTSENLFGLFLEWTATGVYVFQTEGKGLQKTKNFLAYLPGFSVVQITRIPNPNLTPKE